MQVSQQPGPVNFGLGSADISITCPVASSFLIDFTELEERADTGTLFESNL